MADSNSLDSLNELPNDVLAEVVREGELKLDAQLQTALAADNRSLTISGLSLTASTTLLGGAAILTGETHPDLPVIGIAALLGVALLSAGILAMLAARPVSFFLPGNEPENWVPSAWDLPAGAGRTLKRARVEQARVIQKLLSSNSLTAQRNARLVRAALWIILSGVTLAAFGLGAILLARSVGT
jgi:hypothetical protein